MKRCARGLVAGLLLLAGCSADPAPPVAMAPAISPDAGFNEADVMFLQMMVPHDEQGLSIVRLAADRASREEVLALAAAIASTQADEVRTMSGRLQEWQQPPSAPPNSHHDHGGMPDTTEREIATLRTLTGPEFEHRFLNTLIAHQDDAIQLAKLEVSTGKNAGTKALAEQIDHSRAAQISKMLAFQGQG